MKKTVEKYFPRAEKKYNLEKRGGQFLCTMILFFFKLTTRHKILEHQNVKPRP